MTSDCTLHVWPEVPRRELDGLYALIGELLGDRSIQPTASLADICENAHGANSSVLIFVDASTVGIESFVPQFQAAIRGLQANADLNAVLVVGDGYLGSDADDLATTMIGASAVSAMRSLALTRDRPGRSNVICVPEALLGGSGSQRGPLPQPTELIDVAHAISFVLGESGDYVSGQVLFVDGGRHLFSSHTA